MPISLKNIEVPGILKITEFEVRDKEHILISGPSGRGKSTLLHLLGGLLRPQKGEVFLNGQSLADFSEEQLSTLRKNKFGFVFQKLNLIEHLTALENLLLVMKSPSKERALEALKRVKLEDKANLWASQLSLGEQQRVAIMRLLLQDPEILLADEPTSSLDDKNANQVMDLLQQAAQGKILIVVSHDRRLQERFSRLLNIEEIIE
jgi:ABC-type lipoprotein export system ATPase subunit